MSGSESFEHPATLLGRLRLGREEFCQRLLTTLIVGGTYPRWNSRSAPTPLGRSFLRRLDELSFGTAQSGDAEVFVDELELAPRDAAGRGGAPDWAVLWPDRLWLIELKTERGSHRRGQLPGYFDLGGHHFPDASVDITYLTGPMDKAPPPLNLGQRYVHLTWATVLPIVNDVWGSHSDSRCVRYVQSLMDVAGRLDEAWSSQRARIHDGWVGPGGAVEAVTPADALDPTLDVGTHLDRLIRATAADGEQRAIDASGGSLEDLMRLRQSALEIVECSPEGSDVRRVVPWLWRWESTGRPLTAGGAEHGYELRLSRYSKPQS